CGEERKGEGRHARIGGGGGVFPADPVFRLPIFPAGAASACSKQDEISEGAGRRRGGVPASSVAAHDSCGAAAGECSGESAPSELEESAVKPDPKSTGWIRRVRVGANPIERPPCPGRMGALEKTIRGFVDREGNEVVKPELGTNFDSLTEAYDFYNLYSWEHGFGIRYGKNRINPDRRKTMQEIVCGCSVRI
uniref:FAR1 domain-containing protein n=3 Tax=Aegilops tauschii subsp. strangulata TaxID=200361 RepID=A0A453N3K0_AEGTS